MLLLEVDIRDSQLGGEKPTTSSGWMTVFHPLINFDLEAPDLFACTQSAYELSFLGLEGTDQGMPTPRGVDQVRGVLRNIHAQDVNII